MTANEGPSNGLWIEVPATSSAEDLARVVDAYPPGTEGRSYLIHMDLMAGRVAFGDALTERGHQLTVSEELLRRYTFGTQQEHFAVFWLGDDRMPGETANCPALSGYPCWPTPSAEICVSHMPSLKAKKLRKLPQEKVLLEL